MDCSRSRLVHLHVGVIEFERPWRIVSPPRALRIAALRARLIATVVAVRLSVVDFALPSPIAATLYLLRFGALLIPTTRSNPPDEHERVHK
jgi:hypothetical protein